MDKIEILIKRRQAEALKRRKKKTPRDIGSRRRQNEPLPRRLRRTQTGLINFYDLGQRKSGDSWVDVPYFYAPTINTPFGSAYSDVEYLPPTEYKRLTDIIFEVDPSTWRENYRRLTFETAENYGLFVNDLQHGSYYPIGRVGQMIEPETGNPTLTTTWESEGWRKPADAGPTLLFYTAGLFFPFYVNYDAFYPEDTAPDTIEYKITNLPNPDAPEVPFTLGTAADIFFMPAIASMEGQSLDGLGDGETLVGDYRALQRSLYLTLKNSDTGLSVFANMFQTDPPLSDAHANAAFADAKTHARLFSSVDGSEQSISGFPNFPLGQRIVFQDAQVVVRLDPGVGGFIGAIRQNNQMFYLWAKYPSYNITYRRMFAKS